MSKVPDPLPPHDRTRAGKLPRPVPTRAEIEASLGYIQRHACDGVSPYTVIRETQTGLSLGSFSRHFRAATGLTLRAALRQRQLEEARRLLLRTELSPEFIAEHCGFRDLPAAVRAFRAAGSEVPQALLQPDSRRA